MRQSIYEGEDFYGDPLRVSRVTGLDSGGGTPVTVSLDVGDRYLEPGEKYATARLNIPDALRLADALRQAAYAPTGNDTFNRGYRAGKAEGIAEARRAEQARHIQQRVDL